MANSLTDSEAVLTKAAGLPQGHIDRLKDQRLTSLAKLAFAAGQPGETPTDAKLKQLVQVGSDEVPVHVISATRQVVYEAQTLLMAQVRSLIERKDDESKMELAPAERSRQAELKSEKPKKTLEISAGSVKIADLKPELTCETGAPLELSWALQRRALACDLVGLSGYAEQQAWHAHLLRHLTDIDPPPGYSRVSVQQILAADRAAWMKMAEWTTDGTQRKADGTLPLNSLFTRCMSEPSVTFHLLPLPLSGTFKRSAAALADDLHEPAFTRPNKTHKGKGKKGGGKGRPPAPKNFPESLRAAGCHSCTRSGQPICWAYNLPGGCDKAPPGKKCPKAVHVCCKPGCGQSHSFQVHATAAPAA